MKMTGVKFEAPVAPFGNGDTALLPDAVAQTLFGTGEAKPHAFPAQPHAHEHGYQAPETKPFEPPSAARRPTLTIRKK
jgi:hypothetical protein